VSWRHFGEYAVGGLTIGDVAANSQWDTPSGPIDILLTTLGPNETVINRGSALLSINECGEAPFA
jgi:hypothetical protein